MTARTKKRRAARAPSGVPPAWPPSAVAEARTLNAEAWMREAESVADPEASEELKHHRLAIVHGYARDLAKHRGGKPAGAVKASTQYIYRLVEKNPGLGWKVLLQLVRERGEKAKLGRMSESTFRDHVTNAKRRGK
jgi:hypothetical protein